MIAYTTIGTNDLARASAFYDALFASLGAKRLLQFERLIAWGVSPGTPMFGVCTPFDGQAATSGNGTMISVGVDSPAKVDALYAKAISLGAKDEGAPGARGPRFYIGYFRDLDGNKVNFFAPT